MIRGNAIHAHQPMTGDIVYVANNIARAHYKRVIADGGTIDDYPALRNAVRGLLLIYYTKSLSDFIASCVDPAVFGYQFRTEDSFDYCPKLYSLEGDDLEQATDDAQPLILRYSGKNYGYLPGINGNTFSTPDAASLDITEDIDMAIDVYLDASLLTDPHIIYGKENATGDISWFFGWDTGGILAFQVSLDGTNVIGGASTVEGFTESGRYSFRVFRDFTTGDITFYTGTNMSNWVQLGDVVAADPGEIFVSTADLVVGGTQSTTDLGQIRYYGADVWSGNRETGTLVANFQPSLYDISVSQSTLTDSTGKVWTANRSGVGYRTKFVDRTTIQTDGTDDELSLDPFVLVQPNTVYSVFDQMTWDTDKIAINGGTAIPYQQTTATPNLSANAGTALNFSGEALDSLKNYMIQFDDTDSITGVNGVYQAPGAAGAGAFSRLDIGSGAGADFSNINFNSLVIAKQADNLSIRNAMNVFVRGWSNNPA